MANRVASILCLWIWIFSVETPAKVPNSPILLPPVAEDDKQRYLCTALLNGTEGDNEGLDLIRKSVDKGMNAVMVTVQWSYVHPTVDAPANWKQFDNQVNLCKELGVKIFFRITLERHAPRVPGFFSDDDQIKDERGRIHVGSPSMGSQAAMTKGLGFVKEVVERYKNLQAEGHVLCVAVTTTPTQEAGYHFEQKDEKGNPYVTNYDFSTPMVQGYQTWLKDRYGSLKTLNETWRSDYSDFSNIQPVTSDFPHPEQKQNTDWYVYRHVVLKKFLDDVSRVIKATDPNYKVINDFGSVYDGLSVRRVTFAFKDLAKNVDGTKCNDSEDFPHFFSADLMRSNMAPDKWVMNEAFRLNSTPQPVMISMVNQHFQAGCKLVNLVISTLEDIDWFVPTIESVQRNRWLTTPLTTIVPVQSMTVKLSDLVIKSNYGLAGYSAEWNSKKNDGPVNVKLIEDLLGETSNNNKAPVSQQPFDSFTTTATFPVSRLLPDGLFTDPDDTTPLAYEMIDLPAGMSLDGKTLTGAPLQAGQFTVTLKAIDDYGASATSQFTITVKAAQQISVDVYSGGSFQSQNFVRPLKTKDGFDVNSTRFLVNFLAKPNGVVEAVRMELSGPIQQTQIETDAPFGLFGDNGGIKLELGTYSLLVETYNSADMTAESGLGRAVFNFVVEDRKNNVPPIVRNPIPDQKVKLNGFLEYMIPPTIFQDVDGDGITLSTTGLPPGMKAREDGWYFSGMPTQSGNFLVTVEATDGKGATAYVQFTIFVIAPLRPPIVLKTIADQVAVFGQNYAYPVPLNIFQDPDGYIVRLAVSGLPAGLSFLNGAIMGRPETIGTYEIEVKVFDNDAMTVTTKFKLVVKLTNVNLAPEAQAKLADQQATVGTVFSYTLPTLLFKDPEGKAVALEAINLPAGLTLTKNTITGIPTLGGIYVATIRGRDPEMAYTDVSFALTVRLPNGNLPPTVIQTIADQIAKVGVPFSFDVPLNGFKDPDGILVSLYVRNPPPGLTYRSGMLSGTPTQAGKFTVTVGVYDNQGASVEDYFVVKVIDVSSPEIEFTLVKSGDDESRKVIQILEDEDRVVADNLPYFVNIFAKSKNAADQIRFEMQGPVTMSNTDGGTPFGLYDDYGGFRPLAGAYSLTATAYRNGKAVGERTIRFNLTRNAGRQAAQTLLDLTEPESWVAYPNPFDETIMLTVPDQYKPSATTFAIISLQGQKAEVSWVFWTGFHAELNLAPLQLHKGAYILQIQHPGLPIKNIKVMKE